MWIKLGRFQKKHKKSRAEDPLKPKNKQKKRSATTTLTCKRSPQMEKRSMWDKRFRSNIKKRSNERAESDVLGHLSSCINKN